MDRTLFTAAGVPPRSPLRLADASSRVLPSAASLTRLTLWLLWVGIVAYVAVLLPLTFRSVDGLGAQTFDLAIFDQATWLISCGQAPFVTIRGLSILGEHFSAILYLLAPLYWIWPSAKMLLLAQTLALALGALPVYALGRRCTGSPLIGLAFGFTYLLYPALQWSNVFEFHPDTLATPCLLGAFYYMTAARWHPYFLLLGLAALTKETVGLEVAALGLYLLIRCWRTDGRRMGWLTLGLAALALTASFGTNLLLNHGRPSMFFALYGHYGQGPVAIWQFLVTHPGSVLSDLNTDVNRRYLGQLLAPVLFLSLLAPEVLILAAPVLLLNLLSSSPLMHGVYCQYTAFVTPFIFASAVFGLARARRWGNRATQALLVLCLALGTFNGAALRPLSNPDILPEPVQSAATVRETRKMLALIPPQASVTAPVAVLPLLAHRRSVYMFPNPFEKVVWGSYPITLFQMGGADLPPSTQEKSVAAAPVEYVVFSPPTSSFPLPASRFSDYGLPVVQGAAYGIIAVGQDTMVLRRGADRRYGLHLLEQVTGSRIRTQADVATAFQSWLAGRPVPAALQFQPIRPLTGARSP